MKPCSYLSFCDWLISLSITILKVIYVVACVSISFLFKDEYYSIAWRRAWLPTHSSILAWRIPWTEKPGGLQSMGLQTVSRTELTQHACTHCSSECIHRIFLNHSSVDEHVGGRYILAIVENAIMHMEVQISLNPV